MLIHIITIHERLTLSGGIMVSTMTIRDRKPRKKRPSLKGGRVVTSFPRAIYGHRFRRIDRGYVLFNWER